MRIWITTLLLSAMLPLVAVAADKARKDDRNAQAFAVMQASFVAKGQAGMDRLVQDKTQAACSLYAPGMPPDALAATLLEDNRNRVKYPADGNYLGDWKRGQAVAEEGRGKQSSDDPAEPSGGNCYACHQLDPQQIAYGTIGPSLYRYGKLRGNSEPVLKLAWGMLNDMKGYILCSAMPRFGGKDILTEQQLKDVMALLFDPDSPVNQ
ncbi:MAG: sulfur oxidation c-type cytochrome SoxX [Xanthomonadales bacterium]|nr:sulfur oxidation c-type cytochrome SoxX [Xanthomonadales bacterium]